MPPSKIELYEDGGAALLGSFRFNYLGNPVGIPAGLTSDVVTIEVWNAKGDATADVASGVSLSVFESAATLGEWNQRGRATLERWTEARLVDVIGDALPQTTAWTPFGTGRPFLMNPIPPNSARVLEVRSAPPGGVSTYDADFLLSADWQRPALALGMGFEEAGIRGIRSGIGDSLQSFLVEGGDVEQDEAGPSADVTLSDATWLYKGTPKQDLVRTLTFTAVALDGALAANEGYWAAVTRGASSTVPTVTKSNKGADPLSVDARPEPPAGEVFLAWVYVTDALQIEAGDIYQDDRAYGRMLLYWPVGGLNAKVGTGEAVADNFHNRYETPRDVALDASQATLSLWLLPNVGQLATSIDGLPPADRALLLWEGATDADGVTASRDMRRILAGRVEQIRFRFDGEVTAAFGDEPAREVHAVYEGEARAWLRVPEAITVAIDAHGTASAGRTAFDVLRWIGPNPDDFETLFTDFATEDRRPAVSFDDQELSNRDARPQILSIDPGTRLKCVVAEAPAGGTGAAGAEVVLSLEVP